MKTLFVVVGALLYFGALHPSQAEGRRVLRGHVPAAAMASQTKGRLARSQELEVAIGLPLRHREALTNLLQQLYDPASPRYRQFLSPAAFAARFGPSERQYQAVIAFAHANKLRVTGMHPNRVVLDVAGTVADLERAFQTRMALYQHPTEARTFYAPEVEPSVLESLAILDVSGLDNYAAMQPMDLRAVPLAAGASLTPAFGSGPLGTYRGKDFRAAYAPDVTLTGAGQIVGIVAFDSYYPADIRLYERQSKIAHVPLQNVVLGRQSLTPGRGNIEVATDIEMAISMAPGLSKVIVYQAPNLPKYYNDVLNRMATDNVAKQLSSSWGMRSGPNATTDQIFQQFAAQGQSFFQASGDWGAYAGPALQPTDNPYITVVGGTSLYAGESWAGETTWRYGRNAGTGGGISTFYPIPYWQQGLDMSANQGSTTMRNLPDVAMVAGNIGVICNNGRPYRIAGTSAAAPLWAGFMALVNEQAATLHQPPIGFANPALYHLARGTNYLAGFHDILEGNNTTSKSPDRFHAVRGYDLCTGWGSPRGQQLIDDLTTKGSALSIAPAVGCSATGKVGGPFDPRAATFSLANSGWNPARWSLGTDAAWLQATPVAGTLAPDRAPMEVQLTLNERASTLPAGAYTANLWFTNLADGTTQNRLFRLELMPTGALRVTINTAEAACAGARWQVDGGAWQESGVTVSNLIIGHHTVTFSAANGWVPPGSHTAEISANQTTPVTVSYQPNTALQVTLLPAEVTNTAALWQVDGGPWQKSEATLSGLAPGNHTITFAPLWGWEAPPNQTVTLGLNQAATLTGTYVRQFGALQILLEPPDVLQAGARWQTDGGPWQESGATVAGLAWGYHPVTFSPVSGWAAPTIDAVTITSNQVTCLRATYRTFPRASLQVNLYPANAQSAGARWRVDAGPWQESGATVVCEAGVKHTVSFSTAENWLPPLPQTVTLETNALRVLNGVFAEPYSFTTLAGQFDFMGSTDGPGNTSRFFMPAGVAVDSSGSVLVSDSGNSTIRQLTWTGTNWTVTTIAGLAGSFGSSDGTNNDARFGGPAGITWDTTGTVYVADRGNSTIRQLRLEGTHWVTRTIAGAPGQLGNVDGVGSQARFNSPLGITTDRLGNLYVTDTGNHTVRKLSFTGALWEVTTIASQAEGLLKPTGIVALPNGQLVVTDLGSYNLWQLTFTGAAWVASNLAGTLFTSGSEPGYSSQSNDGYGAEAVFRYPYAVTLDPQGNLYVADGTAVRKLVPMGTNWLVSTIGGPRFGAVDGVHLQAGFDFPEALAADAQGRLFVTDTSSDIIRLGTPGPVGSLQVDLSFGSNEEIRAQWRVDEGGWQDSRATVYVPVGEHTVSFSSVGLWSAPQPQTVTIASNQLTRLSARYVHESGTIQVFLTPAEAVTAGARWQVDDGPWLESGAIASGLTLDFHSIRFLNLNGWGTPSSLSVYTVDGQTRTLTGTYLNQGGTLQVTLAPADAVNAGAQWQVDGGPWQTNGATISGLVPGTHVLTYKDLPQWNPPLIKTVSISSYATNRITGTYTPWEPTPPTCTVTTPSAQRWNYPALTLVGKASDNFAVWTVWYQLNHNAWAVANGTSNWAASVELQPGTNTFRAYAEDFSGNKSPTNSLDAVYAPSAPLTLRISGSGTVSPNYQGGMLEVGKTFTITAIPDTGFVFSNWTGGVSSTGPTLSFVMQSNLVLQANFIPNPFLALKGTYSGLFAEPIERRQESSGALNLALTDRGAYSGTCLLGGKAYGLSGQFDVAGNTTTTIVRPGSPALLVHLALELAPEANRLTGELSDGLWVAELRANRALSDSLKDGTPAAGRYTLVFPGATDGDGSVFIGDGYGAVSVSASGRVTFSGLLADGTPVSQSASLGKDGQWPLYVSLYGGTGSLWGWLSFEPHQSPEGVRGVLSWLRPAQPAARLYPAGFTNVLVAEGARYTPPVARTNRVIALTEGTVSFEGGNLRQPFANSVQLTPDNRVLNGSSNKLSLSLLLPNGLFSGSVIVPGTTQILTLKGALLQNLNAGYGFFPGTNQSGRVFLGPQ